ncbi:MAG: hypothetical protein AVDCRST_MAG78-465, partial [uncultured Rubrobacteraceae bacterium]
AARAPDREERAHLRRRARGDKRGGRDLAAPARGGRREGLRVGPGPRTSRLERPTADQDLTLRRPPRLPGPLGRPVRKDLYHRGRGGWSHRGHRACHPLRLQARRMRGRHKGRPERPARTRLRQRGRGTPRLLLLRDPRPQGRARLHPCPQHEDAARLREVRLPRGRRRLHHQSLRQQALHRALLRAPEI